MMMPAPEFWVIVAACAVSSAFAVYMAALPPQHSSNDEIGDMEQLTFEDAIANQQRVLAEVAENNKDWMAEALSAAERLPYGELGTGEDIRQHLVEAVGLRQPKHHNAWGALLNVLVRRGMIQHTGQYRAMRSKTAHGRRSGVYARMPG